MPVTTSLPYDVCPLNLEYIIAKNKELAVTSNMMLLAFLFIMYCLYSSYSYRLKSTMIVLKRYVDLVEKMNNRNEVFDFENGNHDIYNPYVLHEYLDTLGDESESDCEGGEGSESDSDHNPHDYQVQVDSNNNRRVLRSHTRKHHSEGDDNSYVEYRFDRDYNKVRNRKSNLGIQGRNWNLD